MRVFWIVIALLIACFVGVMVLPGESEHPIQDEPAPHMLAEAPASSEEIAPVSADVSLSTDKAEVPTSQPPPSEITKPATQQSEDAPIPAATDQAEPPTGPELPIITDASPSAQKLDKPDDDQETPGQTPADQATSEKPSGWAALTRVAPAPTEETGLSVRVRDDGSLEIGDRFVIQGKGTPDKPYELPWDLLVAVDEFYSPREGKRKIPEFIKELNGKYISTAGYLSFPLATPEPTECLVMLNQWDGCCIGVPPTPYDAIEVTLAKSADRAQRFAVEGRIVGRFSVDPYLVGDWLVGLYLLDDARIDTSNARSAEEVYGSQLPQFQPPGG